jgi:hypothetical protein
MYNVSGIVEAHPIRNVTKRIMPPALRLIIFLSPAHKVQFIILFDRRAARKNKKSLK